ncbi:MAG TPA: mechanosensitive ion channel family protein [Candidatus Binatia bacterium]|nr:mechanosensitive ion channel family protein [Candidatus Binatia bacterium]
MNIAGGLNAGMQVATALVTTVGLKFLGAIAVWIVGRWLIRIGVGLLSRSLTTQKVDATVVRYLGSAIAVLLTVVLIVAILGLFGVETTSFAALFAAGGVAIGVAWSGLLANFAAGVFIIILRPFKVGDFITAGGITGTVAEIGLFGTALDTPDNVRTIVGNNKIFSDNIQNFSTNPHRRVDLTAQLAGSVDHAAAIQLLKDGLAQIPNVLSNPAPVVEILDFTLAGPVLAVRPFCNNAHYWQVYFDTNRLIRESFGRAGYPPPSHLHVVKQA